MVCVSIGKVTVSFLKFNEAMKKVCDRIANKSERTNLDNMFSVCAAFSLAI